MADIEEAATLGEVLRNQIEKCDGTPNKINQSEVALEAGVDPSVLSRVKNDRTPDAVFSWKPIEIYNVLKGFRLSDDEIYRAATKFKLPMPVDFAIRMHMGSAPIQDAQPLSGKLARIPHLGEVSAGMRANGAYGVEMDKREVLADYLDGSNPENCFLLDVTGDSMTCEDIRKSIPPGSTLVVDPTLRPEHGDTIVCELEVDGERTGVVKVYKPTGRGVVLDSYNQQHRPVLLTEEMECTVSGVVVNWIPPGRKALRKHFARS